MKQPITQEQYDNHDCHASPEDGCQVCEDWQNQALWDKETIENNLKVLKAHEMQFKMIEEKLLKAKAEGKKTVNLK